MGKTVLQTLLTFELNLSIRNGLYPKNYMYECVRSKTVNCTVGTKSPSMDYMKNDIIE